MTLSEARAILGVAADAPLDAVRRRYLELAQANHPDLQPPERRDRASQVTGTLNAAWEVIRTEQEARGEEAFRADSGPGSPLERPASLVPDADAASAAGAALRQRAQQRDRRKRTQWRIALPIALAAGVLIVWRGLDRTAQTTPTAAASITGMAPSIALLQKIDTSGLRWGVAEPDVVSGLVRNRTGTRILGHVTLHMAAWNVEAPHECVTRSFPLWADWAPGAVEPISVRCGIQYGSGKFPMGRGTCCLWFEPAGDSAYRLLAATFADGRGCVIQALPGTSQHNLRLAARRFAAVNPLVISAEDRNGPISITPAGR